MLSSHTRSFLCAASVRSTSLVTAPYAGGSLPIDTYQQPFSGYMTLPMDECLIRISYGSRRGDVCAGIVITRGRVKVAAPILRYLIGMKLEKVLALAKERGWIVE